MTQKIKDDKPAGQKRNDLAGSIRSKGNKIYVRYRGKEFSTGFNNSPGGWKFANKWWEEKLKELNDIEDGVLEKQDIFLNIFNKFIHYKQNIQKLQNYKDTFNTIFKLNEANWMLTEDNIQLIIKSIISNDASLSAITINNKLQFLQILINWAAEDERRYTLPKNYVKKYKIKTNPATREPYSEEEYNQFVDFFNKKNENKDHEMVLLIRFLWETGARIGETLSIKIKDINLKDNYINIPNKINKVATDSLLFADATKNIILELIKLEKARKDGRLFDWNDRHVPARRLRRTELKLNLQVQNRGFHGFRRSFADRLFKNKFDIPAVKEIMRHHDITTTLKHYKSYNRGKLVEEMNKKLNNEK